MSKLFPFFQAAIFLITVCISTAHSDAPELPPVPAADAGDAAFFRKALPVLFGRMAKGVDEVEVLSDMAAATSREAVLDSLMAQPEFIENWTRLLKDDLEVQRLPRAEVASPLPTCFGNALRPGLATPDLARHVASTAPSALAPAGAFNMTDLIASAVAADMLSPIYRVYPLPMREQSGAPQPPIKERAAFNSFVETNVSRAPGCLGCHNASFSASGLTGEPGWPRTHPIPFNFEPAIYGPAFGSLEQVTNQTSAMWRSDQFNGGVAPWGLTNCGSLLLNTAALSPRAASFATVSGDRVGIPDLMTIFKSGNDSLAANGLPLAPQPNGPSPVTGNVAYAYLTAMTVSENIWSEVMGSGLTVAHYFPRNIEQRDILWNLSHALVTSNWSLKQQLKNIMLSRYYNRLQPSLASGSSPYDMPMVFDPWVADDPRDGGSIDPAKNFNGQGDVVARKTPAVLLNAVSTSLGWPKTQGFMASGEVFPGDELIRSSGQYLNYAEQGTKDMDFQSLLLWESKLGQCTKPTGVATDWFDRLSTSIASFDSANPTAPFTLQEAITQVKDWIVNDPSISSVVPVGLSTSEQNALVVMFGGSPLNTSASAVPDLQGKLRAYCGVLLKTPLFFLTNLSGNGPGTPPRLSVCNDVPCGYEALCNHHARNIRLNSAVLQCDGPSRSVRVLRLILPPQLALNICLLAPSRCNFMAAERLPYCLRRPQNCMWPGRPDIPVPKCAAWDCPWRFNDGFGRPPFVVAELEGTVVSSADGLSIQRFGDEKFQPLVPGDILNPGDIIGLSKKGKYELKTRFGTVSSEGLPDIKEGNFASELSASYAAALEKGDLWSLAKLSQKHPALVNFRDTEGETILMKAASVGDTTLVRFLLKLGANPRDESFAGLTASDMALVNRHEATTELFAKAGYSPRDGKVIEELAGRVSPYADSYVLVAPDKPIGTLAERFSGIVDPELSKMGAWFKPEPFNLDKLPKDWQQRGEGHTGLEGPVPQSFEEALKAVQAYRESEGFKLSHPDLK